MNATTIVVKEQNQGDTTLDSKNLQESAQSFKKRILLSFVFIFLILASLLSLPTKKKSTAVEKSTKFEFSLEFPTKGIAPDAVIDPTPVNKQFTQQFAAQIAGTSGYSNNA